MKIKSKVKKKLDNIEIGKPKNISNILDNYDYISFDIFDTLIKRDVPDPTDVFDMVGRAFGIKDFKSKRIRAEQKARNVLKKEVNIDDIYSCIDNSLKKFAQKLEKKEIELELELCVRNERMYPCFEQAANAGKAIIISDMYLKKETIEQILKKNGINGYRKLYISNEVGKSKSDGSLFEFVEQDLNVLNPKKMMHIGDSLKGDYLEARKEGLKSWKIKRLSLNLTRGFQINDDNRFLNNFINNHIDVNGSYYKKFGYEAFGPLLYGFTEWLYSNLKSDNFKQVLFLSRDGFIMKKTYDQMRHNSHIPSYYMEVSRRSLRIPNFVSGIDNNNLIDTLGLLRTTTIPQIFDCLGLNYNKYKNIIIEHNLSADKIYVSRDLIDSREFQTLFSDIKKDVIDNANNERAMLYKYLKNFDFNIKTAVVDIGWGGSIQKYLLQALDSFGIKSDITGFYIGLNKKSRSVLGTNGFKGKGYAFDFLNNETKQYKTIERPFVGLFETLFLERGGSVKKYIYDGMKAVAVRYPYEYEIDGKKTKEVYLVKEIQDAALNFVRDFNSAKIKKYVPLDSSAMFNNLYQIGFKPTMDDIRYLGSIDFYNNGRKTQLARPDKKINYVLHPQKLFFDFFDSQWKIGFLKAFFIIPLPYKSIFYTAEKIGSKNV